MTTEHIIWVDVETTGINPSKEHLLQVACLITDGDLNILNDGYEAKILYPETEMNAMRSKAIPYVQEMHDKTDLWQQCVAQGVPLVEAEDGLLAEIRRFIPENEKPRLGGNSITLDRNFLSAYMPRVLSALHYRSYDMSSVSGFLALTADVPFYEKNSTHDAFDDIIESINEAKYYASILRKLA